MFRNNSFSNYLLKSSLAALSLLSTTSGEMVNVMSAKNPEQKPKLERLEDAITESNKPIEPFARKSRERFEGNSRVVQYKRINAMDPTRNEEGKHGTYSVSIWHVNNDRGLYESFKSENVEKEIFTFAMGKIFMNEQTRFASVMGETLPEYDIFMKQSGEDDNTLSSAIHGSSTIVVNVDQWIKSLNYTKGFMASISAGHEVYHVHNYLTDPDESKLGREMSAMIYEAGLFIEKQGMYNLMSFLNHKTKVIKKNNQDLYSLEKPNTQRVIAYTIAMRVYNQGESINELSKRLLYDEKNGVESIDSNLSEMGLDFTFRDVVTQYAKNNGL